MKTKSTHYFIIGSFVTLYLLVSIISTIHVVDFFKLSNPTWLAVSLAIGFEVGAAASLASIIVLDKMNKGIVWGLFILLTAMQAMGNTFYAYSHLQDFTGWVELFGLQEEDLIYQKRVLAIISGAVLPVVALGFIKSLVDYVKPEADTAANFAETIEPVLTKLSPIEPLVEEFVVAKTAPIKKIKPVKEDLIEIDLTTPIQNSANQDELTAKQKNIALYDMPDRSTRRLSPDEIVGRGFKL